MDYAIQSMSSASQGGRGRGGYNGRRRQDDFQGDMQSQQNYNQFAIANAANNYNQPRNDRGYQRNNRNNQQNYNAGYQQNSNYGGQYPNSYQDNHSNNQPFYHQRNQRNFQNYRSNANNYSPNDSYQFRDNRQYNNQYPNNRQEIIQTPNGVSLDSSAYSNQYNSYNNSRQQTPNFRPQPQQEDNRNPRNNFNPNNNRQDYASNNFNNNRSFNDQRERNYSDSQRAGLLDYRKRNNNNNYSQGVNREMTEEELLIKLREKRDISIDNYKGIQIPAHCLVPNQMNPYILPIKSSSRADSVDPTTITALKGQQKMVAVNSSSQVKQFFSFPEMVGKGEVNREQVMGFRELTGVSFWDFQKRGNELMRQIVDSFETTFR